MESFFNRIVGRISHYNQKKRHSLQEGSISALCGEPVTTPDIMDPNRRAYIDWPLSRDDAMDNDVVAKNIDNDRDSNQWKKTKRPFQENRKSSFGIFGRSDRKNKEQSSRESATSQEEFAVNRRPPKKYFSQQNLKSVSMDGEGCERNSPRFNPPRFLWRFAPNQRFKSHQNLPRADCGSSSSVNQHHHECSDDSAEANQRPRPSCFVTEGASHRWSMDGSDGPADRCRTESTWTGSVERRNRCQSLSRLPEISASMDSLHFAHANDSYCPQRQRPANLGAEFRSTRCLGDYRPCLNTHFEEPVGKVGAETELLNGKTQTNFPTETLQSGEGRSSDSHGEQPETKQSFRRSSENVEQNWTAESSKSALTIEHPLELDLDSRRKSFPVGTTLESGLASTSPTNFHFRSPSRDQRHEILLSGTRSPMTSSDNQGHSPLKEITLKHEIASSNDETHVRTLRRLSQELYGDQVQNQRRPDPLGSFHRRSLSMSHLQSNTNSTPQWLTGDGLKFTPTGTVRAPAPESRDQDIIRGKMHSFSQCNPGSEPVPSRIYHHRGGSLDSSAVVRRAYDKGPVIPDGSGKAEDVEGRVFSDTEAAGSPQRSICHVDVSQLRTEVPHQHTDNNEIQTHRNSTLESNQLQQQAIVSLFQKLSMLKQQKQLSNNNNNNNSNRATDGNGRTHSSSSNHESATQKLEELRGSATTWKSFPHPVSRQILSPDDAIKFDDRKKFIVSEDSGNMRNDQSVRNDDDVERESRLSVSNPLNKSEEISANPVAAGTGQNQDVEVPSNDYLRTEVPGQQKATGFGQDIGTKETDLYTEKTNGEKSIDIKSLANCESHQKGLSQNSNKNCPQTDFNESENDTKPTVVSEDRAVRDSVALNMTKSEELKDAGLDSDFSINRCPRSLPGKATSMRIPSTDILQNFETNGNTKCCTNVNSSTLSSESNRRARTVPSEDRSTVPRQHTELGSILKDLSDDEPSSADDETFRSLSAILGRRLRDSDSDLCWVLRPVCVRAGVKFVRRIFEGQKSREFDSSSFQAIVDLRSESKHENQCNESKKDLGNFNQSLHTLKAELLALAEKRMQEQITKTEQLNQLHERTLVLENKVTEIVPRKVDGKQFEKFLSCVEQLEKVIQLFLNLSSRLSIVEEFLCQNQNGNGNETDEKRYDDKRRHILSRIKEATDLKDTIERRSEQVFAHLGHHLTPSEFDDIRSLVRNRCQLLIQRQTIEDHKQLILLQKNALLGQSQGQGQGQGQDQGQCQGQFTQTKTVEQHSVDSNSILNEKISTQIEP